MNVKHVNYFENSSRKIFQIKSAVVPNNLLQAKVPIPI